MVGSYVGGNSTTNNCPDGYVSPFWVFKLSYSILNDPTIADHTSKINYKTDPPMSDLCTLNSIHAPKIR